MVSSNSSRYARPAQSTASRRRLLCTRFPSPSLTTSPSPTTTAGYSNDILEVGQPSPPYHGEGLVPGEVNAPIDGEWVEVTVGSVIGQVTRNEDGTVNDSRSAAFRGGQGRTGCTFYITMDPETYLLYIREIQFRDAYGNSIKPDKRMDYFETYGIDHSGTHLFARSPTLAPTPKPTVWLAGIEISPSSTGGIAMGETIQFKATGIYSDGSTRDITSEAMWFSTNWHAMFPPPA